MNKIINPLGNDVISLSTDFCGRKLTLETGRLGFRAQGSVLVTCGETVVLGLVSIGKAISGMDYFPLSVEYEERFYAAGKISGSRFLKREGKPSDDAVLIGRLIDRPIRPLFPKGFRDEVQVVTLVLSLDPEVRPDAIAMIAASAAITVSGLPFDGPVAGLRVGLVDGQLKAYPSTSQMKESDLDIFVASKKDRVMMVEAGAKEVPEDQVISAIELALKEAQSAIKIQEDFAKAVGTKPRDYELALPNEEIQKSVDAFLKGQLGKKVRGAYADRKSKIEEVKVQLISKFTEELGEEVFASQKGEYLDAFDLAINKDVRKEIIESKTRPDGRAFDEVRVLSSQVSVLPRTHGSAIFTRGMTQALNITTLAPLSFSQTVETMETDAQKRYMHHYNAPGYTLGEPKRLGSPGRREIGHSALAERALMPVLPSEADFPYAIRTVTEIMSQHGSTSMAATCSSTLSLMDAGVPISSPVSGVAMGLIVVSDDDYIVLTDIQDAEDFAGDMDFKVAGTKNGITALQMDMKVHGLKVDVLADAIKQGMKGKAKVLEHMLTVIDTPRAELSPYAPRVESIQINPDKIREIIGKGGEMINRITSETGVEIDINDDGLVMISSPDQSSIQKAKTWIESIVAEPEVGKIYRQCRVVKLMEFGVFVEFMPGTDGLVHVSEMANQRVEKPSDIVKEGDLVDVKLVAIDDKGRMNLSMKQAK